MTLTKNNSFFFQTGQLLLPGFLNALLSLLLSSHRLLPQFEHETLFLLNIAQLLSFGVTVAKYAADQMILTRLHPNEKTSLTSFFLNRVIPLTFIFCLFIFFRNGWKISLTLLLCLPIEVWVIMVCTELNVSGKYTKAMFINLLGYPLFFLSFILLAITQHTQEYVILLAMGICAVTKAVIAWLFRNAGTARHDVLSSSGYVPLQQCGNYLMFKADQLLIALQLFPSMLFVFSLPGDYLFYGKLSEVFAGIATSLSPLIIRWATDETGNITTRTLLRKKGVVYVSLGAILVQLTASVIFLKEKDMLHLWLMVPFMLTTLLIIPVNLVNYQYYRSNQLAESAKRTFLSIVPGVILVLLSGLFSSPLLFSFSVPLQLVIFFISSQRYNKPARV